jgi:alpha-L-arabinofuranosidase
MDTDETQIQNGKFLQEETEETEKTKLLHELHESTRIIFNHAGRLQVIYKIKRGMYNHRESAEFFFKTYIPMLKPRFFIWWAIALTIANPFALRAESMTNEPGVAVLDIDTDRVIGQVEEKIYGQFLEHINHSVEGLFAEQIQGRGFEGKDFETYWKPFGDHGTANIANVRFKNGEKSLRLQTTNGVAGVQQGNICLQKGYDYAGSLWLRPESGRVQVRFQARDSSGKVVASVPLPVTGTDWNEIPYSFSSTQTETNASVEIVAQGNGTVLVDYISMMRADLRTNGMLRPDLFEALRDLKPAFIRWPGGSFASTYRWQDGIGPYAARKYHPNEIWGGYSDYYSFGTEEFLELCRRLNTEPLVVLAATNTDPAQVEYAMNWVHYLNDSSSTKWGKMRAANGHKAPYNVRYFQIDNEPMNFGLKAEQYAEIVNVYGRQLRKIAPRARIVACGQKRSSDMEWSEKLVDIAGNNFDILGCHNYEYENENFETGVRRIQDYLVKLRDYIRAARHPQIKMAVLEWNLCRTYDWRAGLHTAGMLIAYEKLSPELVMTCPALLMRNTTDNPEWRAWIYSDSVSWFPGSGYLVEKLFREHYAERYLASATGIFRDIPNRSAFFDDISQMKPQAWTPGTVDAIATASADGRRIVIKVVNFASQRNTLLARLRGATAPTNATMKIYTLRAALMDEPSMAQPDKIKTIEATQPFSRDLTIDLDPYSVSVVEITRN